MTVIRAVPGLAEQVYQAVLDEICDGVLPPGAHLVQEQLAERFGVSRQPIQQAMALLKADGLVEERGRRGLHVAALDLALMSHHYAIRGALDALAARSAAERCAGDEPFTLGLEARGRKIIEAGLRAVESKAVRDQLRLEESFHSLLYEASDNPLLARSVEPHWRFLRRAMGDRLRETPQPESIWRQHEAILEAVLAGDAALAERLAGEHVGQASEMLSKTFTGAGENRAAPAA
jgi:DNA-binding GntR family transcriptional regulator